MAKPKVVHPMKSVIHQIRAWSNVIADETPLCGADKPASDVWMNRTVVAAIVTCEACKKAANKVDN